MPADLHRIAEILNESVPAYRPLDSPEIARLTEEMSGSKVNEIRDEIAAKGFYVFRDARGRSFKLMRAENGNAGESATIL